MLPLKILLMVTISCTHCLGADPEADCGQPIMETTTPATTKTTPATTKTTPAKTTIPDAGSRIFGGAETRLGEIPWQVSINKKSDGKQFCGGTVIDKKFVLTSAHCTKYPNPKTMKYEEKYAEDIEVFAGIVDQTQKDKPGVQKRAVKNIYEHPKFDQLGKLEKNDSNFLAFDINILELTEPFDLSKKSKVRKVCMPKDEDSSKYKANTEVFTVSGWGDTKNKMHPIDELMDANISYMKPEGCEPYFMNFVLPEIPEKKFKQLNVTAHVFCAGWQPPTAEYEGICFGDGGGPVTWKRADNSYVVVGTSTFVPYEIVEGKDRKCKSGKPQLISDITDPEINEWRKKVLAGDKSIKPKNKTTPVKTTAKPKDKTTSSHGPLTADYQVSGIFAALVVVLLCAAVE